MMITKLLFAAGTGVGTGALFSLLFLTKRKEAIGRLHRADGSDASLDVPIRPRSATEHTARLAGWTQSTWRRWQLQRRLWAGGMFFVCLGILAVARGWRTLLEPSSWFLAIGLAAGGWWWSRLRLEEAARNRQKSMQAALPAFLDRFLLGITAGLNVRQSFRLAAKRTKGDLGVATQRAVQRLDVGATLEEALQPELSTIASGPVRLVLSSLIKAETLGMSLIGVAEEQADFVRRVETFEAQRAVELLPLKLTLCSIAFLFPPVFIIILVPNLLAFIRSGW